MIPPMAFIPEPVTALPKANSCMPGSKPGQFLLDLIIIFVISLILIGGSG